MKTIVVAQQKGGVGKTALSLHLAWYFSQKKNKKVLFIDVDTQGNASYSLASAKKLAGSGSLFTSEQIDFELSDPDPLILIPATNTLADVQNLNFKDASEKFMSNMEYINNKNLFDICVIDTPPSLGNTLASALLVSDFVICPIELETYSIMGIKQMASTIARIKKVNSKLNFLGLLPSKVDKRNPRQVKHLEEISIHYNKYLIPCTIGLRGSIANAIANGIPVWHDKKSAARMATKEMLEFADYVYEKLN